MNNIIDLVKDAPVIKKSNAPLNNSLLKVIGVPPKYINLKNSSSEEKITSKITSKITHTDMPKTPNSTPKLGVIKSVKKLEIKKRDMRQVNIPNIKNFWKSVSNIEIIVKSNPEKALDMLRKYTNKYELGVMFELEVGHRNSLKLSERKNGFNLYVSTKYNISNSDIADAVVRYCPKHIQVIRFCRESNNVPPSITFEGIKIKPDEIFYKAIYNEYQNRIVLNLIIYMDKKYLHMLTKWSDGKHTRYMIKDGNASIIFNAVLSTILGEYGMLKYLNYMEVMNLSDYNSEGEDEPLKPLPLLKDEFKLIKNDYASCGRCKLKNYQTALYRCSRCKNELYCSTICQRADRKYHKKVCTRKIM